MKAFPTMLKGLALDYYYSNISISGIAMNFDQVCYSVRDYFEGAKYKRSILSKWNELILKSVISKNEGKPMEECLEQLIEELRHLQHGLDPELRTDRFIHNKLINACQKITACQYACFKHADSLAGLIKDLRSFIITYTKASKAAQYISGFGGMGSGLDNDLDDDDLNEMVYTDILDGMDETMKGVG